MNTGLEVEKVVAPQFAAEGSQAAIDTVLADAAKAEPEKPKHDHVCASCGKGQLVRKDKQGKPKLDDKGNVLHDRALFLVVKPDGEPARHESGERKRYHVHCAYEVKNLAPPAYRNDVEVVTAFKYDERKDARRKEAGARRKAAQAEGEEVWAGVAKTLGRSGARSAEFSDPSGPKHVSPMAAAMEKVGFVTKLDSGEGKSDKPGKGKSREKGDRRHKHDD